MTNTHHACPHCGKARSYSYRFDAMCCDHCNVWLEPHCGAPKCVFCNERPAKPMDRHTFPKPATTPHQPD